MTEICAATRGFELWETAGEGRLGISVELRDDVGSTRCSVVADGCIFLWLSCTGEGRGLCIAAA